ncbi:oxidoreductase [Bradyrhizobium sp. 14AA]
MTPPHLFSELRIGGVTLQNRIAVAPMSQYSAFDGLPGPWHLQHLGSLSLGGAGLVMIEFCAVSLQGRLTHGCLSLCSDKHESEIGKLIGAIRAMAPGVRIGMQLGHSGRKGSTMPPWSGGNSLGAGDGAWTTLAPSAIAFRDDAAIPSEMTTVDIRELRKAFKGAVSRAIRCEIDCLEIHVVHGSLLHQFLSPLSNHRTDEYGVQSNGRLIREIVEDARSIWPLDRALGVRLCFSDGIDGGLRPADSRVLAVELERLGVDYFCASSGGLIFPAAAPQEPGYQVDLAHALKAVVRVPVRTSGLITDPVHAEAIIQERRADFVAVGRGFLDDPRWGWHAARKLSASLQLPAPYRAVADGRWPALLQRPNIVQ